ncbi:flagellar hook-associated protein FlgK [Kordiimonas sp. SCSIO 12603]|uniref:flagellar hook-associated protein FlgK n=1 Tax=Kordiimonas sp. SCSIO 12603 TaxID=2829596 RepID=UPI002103BAC1|nr:flagellar hook-associated protein FlgK [Kordiimonas sp. SCSIO 12603]UTW57765.1 flagellar hook-associated protein FlgK [Kordiimonas sp. SCSIO 12603]
MSLNGIISTSLTGLFANQAALKATSNNITNVNTPGFNRGQVQLESRVNSGQSSGVDVNVTRVVDEFLETALRTATSNTSEFSVQSQYHDRLQGILGDPASESSLSARIEDVFSSVADLALNPADVLRRQQTISELQSFLDQSTAIAEEIQNLRSDASQQLSEDVDNINELLREIHAINPLIASQQALGGDSSGLEGQLSQALKSLSEMIDIRVDRQPNGAVVVASGDGYPLVDTGLNQLSYNPPGIVSSGTTFPTINVQRVDPETLDPIASVVDYTPHIKSGAVKGVLDLRDKQLPDLADTLGELSGRVADEFNAIQNRFSAVPAPNSFTGKATIVDGGHPTGFTGIVTFAAVDANNQLVASTTVDFDSAPPADFNALITQVNTGLGGAATLALNDGVLSFNGAGSNGVVIADDATTPSDRAGRGFSHFFGLNDLIIADQPGVYETGLTGAEDHNLVAGGTIDFRVTDGNSRELTTISVPVTGTSYNDFITALSDPTSGLGNFYTFSLDSNGALVTTPVNPNQNIEFEITSDTTQIGNSGLSFSHAFGIDEDSRADAAIGLQVKDEIQSNPMLLSLGVFDVSGSVGDVVLTSGDQRGALAFQNIENKLVSFESAGELTEASVTLSQYVARFLGNAGLQAARASNFEEDNLALQNEISTRNSNISGVNIDEELSNLIVYQNAYQAAARILSSVQELYDSLLQVV